MTLLLVLTTSSAAQRDDTAAIIKAYTPLRKHAELFDGRKGWERWIDPPLLEAIRHGQTTGSRSKIDELLRVETPEVYSFQLLSEEFCDAFLEELDNYYSTGLPVHRPNSMNNYGIIVNQIGMKPAITWLQHTVLHPLSQLLFPIQAQGGFDDHHSFMVKYKAGQVSVRRALEPLLLLLLTRRARCGWARPTAGRTSASTCTRTTRT